MKTATISILFAAALSASTVEIRASSDNTWIAWRSVTFFDQSGDRFAKHYVRCVAQSKWSETPCTVLGQGEHWNAGDYHGWVRFRVPRRPAAIWLEPCCGDPLPFGWRAVVSIDIRIDGRVVHRAIHRYSLEREGTFLIELPNVEDLQRIEK